MRNQQKRWLLALIGVLMIHALVLGGLAMQRRAEPVSVKSDSSVAVAPALPTSTSGSMTADSVSAAKGGADGGATALVQKSPSSTSSSEHSVAPHSAQTARESNPNVTASTSAVSQGTNPKTSENTSNHGSLSNGTSGVSGATGSATDSMSGVGAAMGSGDTHDANGEAALNCAATIKPANANAASGLDVAVWVERSSGGARFVSLVNQMGEGSRYVREIRAAVANVQFVSHDTRCLGQKVKVRVRIVS